MITKPVITKRLTLSAGERLKSRKLIAAVFSQGKGISLPLLRAVFLPVPEQARTTLQAGFSASSRNFKRAVDRNRIKRLMRETYRREKPMLEELLQQKSQSLALFLIYTGKQVPDYTTVHGQMLELMRLLTKKLDQPSGNPGADRVERGTARRGADRKEPGRGKKEQDGKGREQSKDRKEQDREKKEQPAGKRKPGNHRDKQDHT